jgi:hypothetical protein
MFNGLVHEQSWPRCPLGLLHTMFQFLPVTSLVLMVIYNIPHPSGTPTCKSKEGLNQVSKEIFSTISSSYPLTWYGFIEVTSDISVVACWYTILLKAKWLIPVSHAHCFADFCGDHVKTAPTPQQKKRDSLLCKASPNFGLFTSCVL